MIGEGAFVSSQGAAESALTVLNREGLRPIELAEKEGVALINGTSPMGSYLALAVADLRGLVSAAEVAAAMSFDALLGNLESFDDRLGELRNLAEQRKVAAAMRALLDGSSLAILRADYVGQDPYTLRRIPQVLAAVEIALGLAESIISHELNAVTDNPVVFEGDVFLNGGNFHGENLAFALDELALAVQYVAAFSERRDRAARPSRTQSRSAGVPRTDAGPQFGIHDPQYLAAALVNENATLVHPVSASSLPTSADQEDFGKHGRVGRRETSPCGFQRPESGGDRVVSQAKPWSTAVRGPAVAERRLLFERFARRFPLGRPIALPLRTLNKWREGSRTAGSSPGCVNGWSSSRAGTQAAPGGDGAVGRRPPF